MKTIEKLRERLLYKRIKEMDSEKLTLEDGTTVTFECTDQDCCAWADGEWTGATLDAVITDVKLEDYQEEEYENHEQTNTAKLVIYHNRNSIAQADLQANNGNGGYYFSVLSVFVNKENIGAILSC